METLLLAIFGLLIVILAVVPSGRREEDGHGPASECARVAVQDSAEPHGAWYQDAIGQCPGIAPVGHLRSTNAP